MGALDEGHLDAELEGGVKLGILELGLEGGSETGVIENAVRVLLQGLGEDSSREGLRKTPLRVAKALREGTKGYSQKVKDIVQGALFPEAGLDGGIGHAGGAGGLVVVRDIDLFSYCESCLLPFKVRCHVGYVPSGQRVVGLSKLPRVADVFAKRLQDPQRLSDQICTALHNSINPAGVAVILQCLHIQFPAVERTSHNPSHPNKLDMQGWVQVSVSSGSGVFGNKDGDAWADFLALLKFRGVNIERSLTPTRLWCTSTSPETLPCNGHTMRNPLNGRISTKAGPSQPAMVAAVASILHSLGEDPLRKELVFTPHRFVHWLTNFKTSNTEMKLNNFSYGGIGPRNHNLHKKASDVGYDRNKFQSELNLPFWSQCEHHLLPFHGMIHIAYFLEEDAEFDRSILQSIVHFHGCKLQVQERLTRQIAETVFSVFSRGVMVVVEAQHICMMSRGIEKVGSSTATIAVLGQFSNDPAAKENFLQSISNNTESRG
ncbi:GTP cyclohydrolase 1-like [Tasmannia lanceolata]|uniref:GTP cyclohydrolase 1-like n=1 Tax=Tasmannia lanceolata TaxID=3420 RepID=UPI0040646BA6